MQMVSQSVMLVFLGALVTTASGREFLGAKRKISSAAVKAEVNGVLDEVLGQGHGLADARLSKIHKTLDPLFRALPKNHLGHISAPVMRYAVRRYFSQTHGWIVKGFGAHEEQGNSTGNNVDSVVANGDSDMLQTMLPGYIRSIFEDRFAQQGFSLDTVVALVATVERMAFDEVVRGVELAFDLNDLDRYHVVSTNELTEIVSSFLLVEMLDGAEDKVKHKIAKSRIHKRYPHWDTTMLFLVDAIGSDMFRRQASSNPFKSKEVHSFEDATRISEHISEEFASWSDHECHEMKDMLMEMDVHGTGRVKISDFYTYSKDGAWQFEEASEKLRQQGILDESSMWLGPQVMIPNYITSTANCITTRPYYQICCLNECDSVFQQLESRIAAPSATPTEIIDALESGVHAPISLSSGNRERLDEIARVNGNQIPLYGRLFARWLHFLYPQECPYPHAEGAVKQMSNREWKELVGGDRSLLVASQAEVAQHLQSQFADRTPSPDAGATMWSLEESLLESSTTSDSAASSMLALLRIAVQLGMLTGLISTFWPVLQATLFRVNAKEKVIEYNV